MVCTHSFGNFRWRWVGVETHKRHLQYRVLASLGRGGWRSRVSILLIIVSIFLLIRKALPQEPEQWWVAQSVLSNVVRIEAQMQGHVEEGFGFVVGEKAGSLYIVTAYHVVSGTRAENRDSQVHVKVEFPGVAGGRTVYDAKLMESHDEKHDLAVLMLPAPPGTGWNSRCVGQAREQKRPTELYFIGKSKGPEQANWYTAPTPGHVVSEEPVDYQFEIDGLWAASGSAGGPVIATTGIVGMIQKSTPDHTTALSIDFIRTAFLKWNYPWGCATTGKP